MIPHVAPILGPGSTLGILGGGQLGRMAAMAARTLGYRVHVLDPDPACAARGVVDECVVAAFDDPDGAALLASRCQVVTLEIEKIGPASMAAAAARCPVRPGPAVLALVQDRAAQKEWLQRGGFPIGPWHRADSSEATALAVARLGHGPARSAFIKARTGGYDGRGQVRVDLHPADEAATAARAAYAALGGHGCVVEAGLALQAELSVLVARSPRGEVRVYPPAQNHHVDRILDWSLIPGPLPPAVATAAMALAGDLAVSLQVEGLLAVELFLTEDEQLLVNELSPRPHNTFHATEVGCLTGQFEQLVRAVCGLPLGSVEVTRPAAIVNLLGDLWLGPQTPDFAAALALPGVRLHLYGKGPARPGRKMGHLSAVGATPEEALALCQHARRLLRRD